MVKIRLARFGSRDNPKYRIVVIDSRKKREGAPLETIGAWDPIKKLGKIDFERYNWWTGVGAKPTLTVSSLTKRLKAS